MENLCMNNETISNDIRNKISILRRSENKYSLIPDRPARNDSLGIRDNEFYKRNDEQFSLFPGASKLLASQKLIAKVCQL